MRENFTGYEFVLLIGSLFTVLTIVHSMARVGRKLTLKRSLKQNALPFTAKNKTVLRTPSIKILTIQKAKKEEELV